MSKKVEVEGIDVDTYAGKAVLAVKTKAKGMFGDSLLIFNLIDFVSLMMLNNRFLNKGIVITDENKEECYIKIIEIGDESLINDLEKYIELKDRIKVLEARKDEYTRIVTKLQKLADYNDEETINGIVEEYLRR